MRRRFSVLKRSPWHEHQAGEEAPEAVAAHEQPQTLALAQMQDPDRRLEQLVGRHLEELVPRMRLELLDQRLLVVTAAGKAARSSTVANLRGSMGISDRCDS